MPGFLPALACVLSFIIVLPRWAFERTDTNPRPAANPEPGLLGRLGEAMADYEGRPVFVFGGIPGESVVAQVLRVHRKYISARVTQVLEPSPDRVEPPCPYFGDCTGCQWQHVGYSRQLAVKREKVVDALERVGGFRTRRLHRWRLHPISTVTEITPGSP